MFPFFCYPEFKTQDSKFKVILSLKLRIAKFDLASIRTKSSILASHSASAGILFGFFERLGNSEIPSTTTGFR